MFTTLAVLALAQQPLPGQPPARPLGNAPVATEQTFRVKSVLGAAVRLQGDASAGIVEDLVFDQDGQIEYAIVADQGKLVTVPWAALQWAAQQAPAAGAVPAAQPVPMTATIAIPVTQYRTIPTFTTTTYPSFYTPAYRTQVYQYYGLTPRERRVIERRVR